MSGDFRPLEGVRVIDLTSNMSGPLATMVLAEQGADVVKVEPPAGDLIRTVGTGRHGMSAYFANLNRGKRSIAVDLSVDAGAALVRRLASTADVFVQNFRPGVVERLGLGPDVVMGANERLVYGSISGFGLDGPLATEPAYDHVVQALSGFAALQAAAGGEPDLVRQGAIDKASAYTLAQAITAALLQRTTTGRGARIDVSMLDVALAFIWPDGMMNNTCVGEVQVLPPVSRSFRTTPTADGYVVLVTLTAKQWDGLVAAILTEPDDDTGGDLSDTGARMSGGAEIMRAVRQRLRELPTDEVVRRLREADVPCAPVRGLDELHLDEQIGASRILEVVEHPIMGTIRQPGPAPLVDGARPARGAPAAATGAHTREVLVEHGWSDAEVDALAADGVVALTP
ncbi:MAG TPA: CoA transferase [Acidimicrobiales bacterium]|nr:CoA transferase [Acidimicrobiales bacterium]